MHGFADLPVSAFLTGLLLSGSLIVAIGAQNAFVLRQGLKREYVPQIVGFCVGADVILMVVGVAGVGGLLAASPMFATVLTICGSLFLLSYGVRALRNALRARALAVTAAQSLPLRKALAQLAAFTFLNPHVYLDTVVLIGSVGARQPDEYRTWFVAGALMASATWFTALGFGARLLRPWFAHPRAWKLLDGIVGLMMLALGVRLAQTALNVSI